MAQLEIGSGQDRSRRGSSAYAATTGRPSPLSPSQCNLHAKGCDAPAYTAVAFVLRRVLASFIFIVLFFSLSKLATRKSSFSSTLSVPQVGRYGPLERSCI
ncbi:hypothetical protein MRX96_043403 [Rhipicephalus microplus]